MIRGDTADPLRLCFPLFPSNVLQLLSSLASYRRMNAKPQVHLLSIVAKNYDFATSGWEGIIIDL